QAADHKSQCVIHDGGSSEIVASPYALKEEARRAKWASGRLPPRAAAWRGRAAALAGRYGCQF
ncbi:hypothetical protein PWG14_07150, partial (plasmid) [Chromobacterium amazonense]|uniref:hypothetical protein n=1 Tax=Chromobacterium amazonense TaxID=1382803 RepID=UPI00237D6CCF